MRALRNFALAVVILLAAHAGLFDTPVAAQGSGASQCSCGAGGCVASYVGCWEACPGSEFGLNCSSLCSQTGCGVATGGGGPSCNQGGGCGVPPFQAFSVHVSNSCNCCKPNGNACGADAQCCSGYCDSGTCNNYPHCSADGVGCFAGTECCSSYCTGGVCVPANTPILLNLRNDATNYHLTSPANGVVFDINADENPEQIAWTRSNSAVAFLALDRNNNGTIDDGSELFGNSTRKRDGSKATNGFDALLDLDGGTAVSDGKIAASDAIYGQLRLWLDENHNGVSEAAELFTLEQKEVSAIFTAYLVSSRRDRHGNEYRLVGAAFLLDRRGEPNARTVFDVNLR